MSDLSITAGSVLQGSNARLENGVAGETITAGQAVYKDVTSGSYFKADCDSGSAPVRVARGIALNGASAGQPLVIQRKGQITIGSTMTAGLEYYLSKTPGGICLVADIATGGYPCTIGIAISTTVLDINIASSPAVQ